MQSDARIKFPGYEPDHQEKLITVMELSGTGGSEDRIASLEQKLTEMEALVKGLIAELLDLKALAMTMSREADEYNRQELKRGSIVQGNTSPVMSTPSSPFITTSSEGSTVIHSRGTHQPDVPVAPAEPEMVRIMQSDGTMKMEPRYGEAKHIDSSGGYGRNRKDTAASSKQAPLIYAAEKDKSDRAKV
ncbi:MAG: hypothetical protein WC593_01340 [Methanoregula sp.]